MDNTEDITLYVEMLNLQMKKAFLVSKINDVIKQLVYREEEDELKYDISYIKPTQKNIDILKENVELIQEKWLYILAILEINKKHRFSLIKKELGNVKLI
jgi:Sec7-like guanine-nucleotide exchange factor